MGINYASFYGDNIGSPDTGHQYGPYNLGTCNKMLHIVAELAISPINAGSIAPDATLTYGYVWGVQWVPHGDSPLALPAFAFDQQFFWAEFHGGNQTTTLAWTPSTDGAAFTGFATARREWRGQMPINQDIDLYVTTAYTVGTPPDFEGSFLMRVTNST